MYQVTKTYGAECGLSATFRQWRAKSHCRFMHGYALEFKFTFQCEDEQLDENGWVINFGGLKPLKAWLEQTFDHKTLVAQDDPDFKAFINFSGIPGNNGSPLIQLVEVPATGCEAFAKLAYDWVSENICPSHDVQCVSVEVREHGANSAIYHG